MVTSLFSSREKARLERTITDTFAEHGLVVFDYAFAIRPNEVSESVRDIWGGYQLSFKVTTPENQAKASGNLAAYAAVRQPGVAPHPPAPNPPHIHPMLSRRRLSRVVSLSEAAGLLQ